MSRLSICWGFWSASLSRLTKGIILWFSGMAMTSMTLNAGSAKNAIAHASNISVSRWTTGRPRAPVSRSVFVFAKFCFLFSLAANASITFRKFSSPSKMGSLDSDIRFRELSPACAAQQDVGCGWCV